MMFKYSRLKLSAHIDIKRRIGQPKASSKEKDMLTSNTDIKVRKQIIKAVV